MSKPKPRGRAKTDWSAAAQWYDDLVGDAGSEYHQAIVLPGVLRMLATRPGERVIDIACGQGVLCRRLAEQGAEVTGIDAAAPLIQAALQRGPQSIRYQVADARLAHGLPEGHFHAAACVLAIENIHPLPPVLAAAARLLAPGGRFVLAMMHPCFRAAKQSSWGWDAEKKIQYRRVEGYLMPRKTPIVTHPGADPTQYTWSFHRPLQEYVKALSRAGLWIDALEEWPSHKVSDSGPRMAAENAARKEIPLFLALRAVKIVAEAVSQ
jgi:ubiquinone/menaquinone biosynthesis C-methylase UbiE